MKINGETRLAGIIGHPLTYTLSPAMHNAAFERLNMNFAYVPLIVGPESLYEAVRGLRALGFIGVNVTMPHKETVLPFMDDVASYAEMVGAVNTIHIKDGRITGYNTDGRAFIASLESDGGFDPAGKSVVILGAGGAARSVAASLCLAKARCLTIVNRSIERAQALVETMSMRFAGCSLVAMTPTDAAVEKAVKSSDLLVSAIPVGLDATELPPALQFVSKKQLVFDLVYTPAKTPVVEAAEAKGARGINGLGMLVYQGANAFEIWTQRTPPVDVMLEAAREALSSDTKEEPARSNPVDELAGLLDGASGSD
ncbi:MAG: shikimate dehydrogenase [Actinobacteria bacterium]|nr:MAG: shikimate dehydrogenase [Actinomycetota bacterium]